MTERTHWVTLEGGEAPNVVPDRATTWYFIRDLDEHLESRFDWVMDCAKGAALMTQTTYEVKILTAIHQSNSSKELAELIYENMKAVGKPEYTEEEEAFARAVQENTESPIKGLDYPIEISDSSKKPYMGGSSDVADVTLIVPCAGVRFPGRIPGSYPGHHWAIVAGGINSIAHKGITAGAKAAAGTTYDLLTKPEVLAHIRTKFEEYSKEHPYKTFLPDNAEPPLGWNTGLMEKYRGEMAKFYINHD